MRAAVYFVDVSPLWAITTSLGPPFRKCVGMKLEDPLDAFRPSFPVLMTGIDFLVSQT
jgi:hypothetical protein